MPLTSEEEALLDNELMMIGLPGTFTGDRLGAFQLAVKGVLKALNRCQGKPERKPEVPPKEKDDAGEK